MDGGWLAVQVRARLIKTNPEQPVFLRSKKEGKQDTLNDQRPIQFTRLKSYNHFKRALDF